MNAFLDTFAALFAAIVGLGVLFGLGMVVRILLGRRAAVKELAELRKLVDEMQVGEIPDFTPPRPFKAVREPHARVDTLTTLDDIGPADFATRSMRDQPQP